MSHWSSSRPLASDILSILDPHGNSSWISCCCPVWWRYCSFGFVGLPPSYTPAVHRCFRCLGRQTQSPESGPESCVRYSAHWLSEAYAFRASSLEAPTTRASLVLPRWGAVLQLMRDRTLITPVLVLTSVIAGKGCRWDRASEHTAERQTSTLPSGSSLLCYSGEVQGLLS